MVKERLAVAVRQESDLLERQRLVEEQLTEIKDALTRLRRETIPDIMNELGIEELTLESGEKIKLTQDVVISIPEETRAAAYDWLVEHNYGGILKSTITTEFDRGELDKARHLLTEMLEEGYHPELKESVHSSTLKSWAKERVAAGDDVPDDLFNLSSFAWAKITRK